MCKTVYVKQLERCKSNEYYSKNLLIFLREDNNHLKSYKLKKNTLFKMHLLQRCIHVNNPLLIHRNTYVIKTLC